VLEERFSDASHGSDLLSEDLLVLGYLDYKRLTLVLDIYTFVYFAE
jgi:hypothetical protein